MSWIAKLEDAVCNPSSGKNISSDVSQKFAKSFIQSLHKVVHRAKLGMKRRQVLTFYNYVGKFFVAEPSTTTDIVSSTRGQFADSKIVN